MNVTRDRCRYGHTWISAVETDPLDVCQRCRDCGCTRDENHDIYSCGEHS